MTLNYTDSVLSGGRIRRYTTESASHPGQQHELVVVSGRVSSCTCPGWGFRHECRHAARLGAFLAEFQADARTPGADTFHSDNFLSPASL